MNIKHLIKASEHFLSRNSPAILTGVGVVGVAATAYLTHKATVKMQNELHAEANAQLINVDDIKTKYKMERFWKLYIAPVAAGVITVGSIVCANRVGTRRTAAMAAAAALVERSYDEYRSKVVDTIGEKKDQEIRQKIAEEQIVAHPPAQYSMAKQGKVLTRDGVTGRYFDCDVETVRRAENKVNKFILENDACSLSFFYHEIGLPSTDISDDVGWNHENVCDVDVKSVVVPAGVPGVPEGLPALYIEYTNRPTPDPHKYR